MDRKDVRLDISSGLILSILGHSVICPTTGSRFNGILLSHSTCNQALAGESARITGDAPDFHIPAATPSQNKDISRSQVFDDGRKLVVSV